jgi:hypothetical protein
VIKVRKGQWSSPALALLEQPQVALLKLALRLRFDHKPVILELVKDTALEFIGLALQLSIVLQKT